MTEDTIAFIAMLVVACIFVLAIALGVGAVMHSSRQSEQEDDAGEDEAAKVEYL